MWENLRNDERDGGLCGEDRGDDVELERGNVGLLYTCIVLFEWFAGHTIFCDC